MKYNMFHNNSHPDAMAEFDKIRRILSDSNDPLLTEPYFDGIRTRFSQMISLTDPRVIKALAEGKPPLVSLARIDDIAQPGPGTDFINARFTKPEDIEIHVYFANLLKDQDASVQDEGRRALHSLLIHEFTHYLDSLKVPITGVSNDSKWEKGEYVEAHVMGKTATYVTNARMPRGIRNNNPGNIRVGDNWRGLATDAEKNPVQREETAFCVFKSPHWGLRAMARLLNNYQRGENPLHTVRAMIGRWAPPKENNTQAYIADVARRMGFDPDQPFDFGTRQDLAVSMMKAMIIHENGQQPYDDAVIVNAYQARYQEP